MSTIALIATGRDVARMAYSRDPEEQRKAILGIALEGVPTVLLDNVAGAFGSPALDAALTSTTCQGRLLGANRMATAPLQAVWFATGNNLILVGDTARRCLHIRLESPEEYPEERQHFKHPRLLEWLEGHRAGLTVAALTLLRAFCAAGRPQQGLTPWGSFEGWSALVRECVAWLGLPDPGGTRLELRSSVVGEGSALSNFIAGLEEVYQGLGLQVATARDILSELERVDHDGGYLRLREALGELVPRLKAGELPSTGQLGKLLRSNRGRVIAGRAIDAQPHKTKHGALWSIRSAIEEVKG